MHGSKYSEITLWMSGSHSDLLRGIEEFSEVSMRPDWCCEGSQLPSSESKILKQMHKLGNKKYFP